MPPGKLNDTEKRGKGETPVWNLYKNIIYRQFSLQSVCLFTLKMWKTFHSLFNYVIPKLVSPPQDFSTGLLCYLSI